MAVIPKEPLDWMTLLQLKVDEVFDLLARSDSGERLGECDFVPLVDIFETPDSFTIEVELPGFEGSEISLKLCCNMLIVEGTKRDDTREGVGYICLERHFGRFCRAIEVPPTVDLAGVRARYRQGVLTVVFPRLSDKGQIIREIPIEQGDV
ncbi:Hsp20/alpha crystallin family protein [Geobacter pickeringii]|uniref:Molecular chaperone n=1 Tax=Geobacter pickeringii TaxID=345632 RepID=A0A0B5BDA5_9BACT|nr:Hsp20/alpha crystallin family protein [Geobacter pickeringii]AJE04447.1 molecular chaperone [Geobacter pickeringii]